MQDLNLPSYQFKVKKEKGKSLIFDLWRKKWLVLTPEEWVRQNFIRFLIEEYHYPASAIGLEVGLSISGRQLRADALAYNNQGNIAVLLEFKAPTVNISEKVFSQAADYNTHIGADYIIISNGLCHFCAQMNAKEVQLIDYIPDYKNISLQGEQ